MLLYRVYVTDTLAHLLYGNKPLPEGVRFYDRLHPDEAPDLDAQDVIDSMRRKLNEQAEGGDDDNSI